MRTIVHLNVINRVLLLLVVALSAVQALADTGSAESQDFLVNTVPEPAAALVVAALFAFCLKRNSAAR